MQAGAEIGAEQAAADGIEVFDDEVAWDVLEEIPNDSAAALILLEHHWAVPLRDAIARAGGYRIATGSSVRSTCSRSAWPVPRRRSSSRRRRGRHRSRRPEPASPTDLSFHPPRMTRAAVSSSKLGTG